MKANFIGAVSGIIVYALPLELYLKIIIGIAAASLLCKYLNLANVSRSAVVALIIVMIERQDDGFTGSLERFLSVTLGCIIGLLITVTTAIIIKFTHRKIIQSIYKR
ncbi:aromatic acid exporter family protein [Chryseobacterium sp. MFBS3-17]|uniref:aromatic acid exporter family protein n=1 Tax=Chryseobacterium sp. MFBS3-17 TaxID=2886689 RepID=UPI001D0EAB7B|nr:aromatic acid exporter family protein [Chryseobacterium sp. MFBS3-17]MCC2590106.1 aromatic acid exporter family protein [Chryseobacterium sp. MFBS3-17]